MRRVRRAATIATMVAAGIAVTGADRGAAQSSSDCILDNCADRRPVPDHPARERGPAAMSRDKDGGFGRSSIRPRGASRPGAFDFYVLSLSWSPGFCATGGAEKARDQCRSGSRIGFTVHGLWPQYDHGFPSDCRGATSPPRDALAETAGVYPDERLARYEWRRHGTCSGLSPGAYFAAAKSARDAVVLPPAFRDPHEDRTIAPADIERAFVEANPALRPGMLAAVCRDGTLEEVRICFARDLKSFQACPEVAREACRSRSIAVPALR